MTKILIIRFRRIGDSVISSTLCSSLKKSIPNAEIHYVLNESIAPLFSNHPDINKVITFSNDDMSSFSKYIKKVRSIMIDGDYDIIVDTRSTIKTMFFSLFSMKTSFRIGRKKWYNKIIQNYRINNVFDGSSDNAQITLDLLDPLTAKYKIEKDSNFKLYYTSEEFESYKRYMKDNGIDFTKPIIICGVTTRIEGKAWSKEKMKEVLARIINKYDAQLIFNYGDATEKQFAMELQAQMNNDPHIFTSIEAKGLRELICLLANSNFFFGNEGGTRHISQALGIPSFAIYPPGVELANWLPNRSEKYNGIELSDIVKDSLKYENLTYDEKLDLIDTNSVWLNLNKSLSLYIK